MKKQYLVIDRYGGCGSFFDSLDEAVDFAKKEINSEYVDDAGLLICKTENIAHIYIPTNPEPIINWIDTTI